MKLAVQKNHLGGLILYRSLDSPKKRRLCDVFHKEEPYVPPPKLVKDMTLKEVFEKKFFFLKIFEFFYFSSCENIMEKMMKKFVSRLRVKFLMSPEGAIFTGLAGHMMCLPGGKRRAHLPRLVRTNLF